MWGCHMSYLFNGPRESRRSSPQQRIRTLRYHQKAGLKHRSGFQGDNSEIAGGRLSIDTSPCAALEERGPVRDRVAEEVAPSI